MEWDFKEYPLLKNIIKEFHLLHDGSFDDYGIRVIYVPQNTKDLDVPLIHANIFRNNLRDFDEERDLKIAKTILVNSPLCSCYGLDLKIKPLVTPRRGNKYFDFFENF